jgi:hypothetical protein
MDFKRHIETAWNLTLANIVSLILMTLVMVAISSLTLGILAPVTMAGYTQSLLQLVRNGREPKVQDLFSHMNLFLPLLGPETCGCNAKDRKRRYFYYFRLTSRRPLDDLDDLDAVASLDNHYYDC